MSDIDGTLAPPGTRLAPRKNLKPIERAVSLAAGTLVGALAARTRGVSSLILGMLGSALVARGITGASPAQRLLGQRPDEAAVAEAEGWSSGAVASRSVTINAARPLVYSRFRDIGAWAEWAVNIKAEELDQPDGDLKVTTSGISGPMGWVGDVTEDRQDELLTIASATGSDVPVTMRYEFRDAPGGRGTEIHGAIAYEPPGGSVGRYVAKLTQREPGIQLRRDLKRFKSLVEAGEIAVNAPQGTQPKA